MKHMGLKNENWISASSEEDYPVPQYTPVLEPIDATLFSDTENHNKERCEAVLAEGMPILKAFLRIQTLATYWTELWEKIKNHSDLAKITKNRDFINTYNTVKMCLDDVTKNTNFKSIEEALSDIDFPKNSMSTEGLSNKKNQFLKNLNLIFKQTNILRENMLRLLVLKENVDNLIAAIRENPEKNDHLLIVRDKDKKSGLIDESIESVFNECTAQLFPSRLNMPLVAINKIANDHDIKICMEIIENETEAANHLQSTPTLQNAEKAIVILRQKAAEKDKSIIKPNYVELTYRLIFYIDAQTRQVLNENEKQILMHFRNKAFQLYLNKNNETRNNSILINMQRVLEINKKLLDESIYNKFVEILFDDNYTKINKTASEHNEKLIAAENYIQQRFLTLFARDNEVMANSPQ